MLQGLALLLRQAALLMLWKLLAPAPTAPATSTLADSCNKLAAVGGLVVCQFVGGVLGVQVGDCLFKAACGASVLKQAHIGSLICGMRAWRAGPDVRTHDVCRRMLTHNMLADMRHAGLACRA